jgi:chromate transporter
MALSRIYVIWGNVSFVAGLFFGLKSAVLALAAHMPCWRMSHSRLSRGTSGLQPGEMLIGLGMAETTPGPLTDGLSPLMTATLAGLPVTSVTFTPCFLWVFLGAPPTWRLYVASARLAPHCLQ